MFGKNKVSNEEIESLKTKAELDEHFFAQMEEGRDMFEAEVTEIAESYRQVNENVNQVSENMKTAAAFAEENAKVEATLIHSLSECGERLAKEGQWQEELIGQLRQLSTSAAQLVDENKHLTTPSKYLNELPASLKTQNHSYVQSLDEMSNYSRQMGVLALNAAIEAGRMGESGKQFVAAAEEIRTYASNYEREVQEVRTQLAIADKRIEELEEQIKHVVSLLKENNMSAARLMKACSDVVKDADKHEREDFAKEAASLKDQVTILKNADEEIIKSEERNRMQVEDLIEEFASQERNQKEIFELMDQVFRHVVERKAGEN